MHRITDAICRIVTIVLIDARRRDAVPRRNFFNRRIFLARRASGEDIDCVFELLLSPTPPSQSLKLDNALFHRVYTLHN